MAAAEAMPCQSQPWLADSTRATPEERAEMAEDMEYDAIMTRWGKRKSSVMVAEVLTSPVVIGPSGEAAQSQSEMIWTGLGDGPDRILALCLLAPDLFRLQERCCVCCKPDKELRLGHQG